MSRGLITLTGKELKRVKVLERLSGGRMNGKEAAETLGICGRQLRRIVRKYETGGAEGIIHGNRGRKPTHALPENYSDPAALSFAGFARNFNVRRNIARELAPFVILQAARAFANLRRIAVLPEVVACRGKSLGPLGNVCMQKKIMRV